ncbi:DUF4920 domain-containing protein [bacterium]|nr:DUF4920 domain-containing protein [bacterium]
MKLVYYAIAATFLFVSCKDNSSAEHHDMDESHEMAEAEEAHEHDMNHEEEGEEEIAIANENGFYGEEFNVDGTITFEEALTQLGDNDSLVVKLSGPVNQVCQVKGCWMTIGNNDKTMRVRFKDYDFFVPKDCAGKTARINGVMKKEIVSIDEQKHYLADANATQEEIDAITEPKEKLTFLASGVKLQ